MKKLLLQKRQFLLYCLIGGCGVTLDFLVYSLLLQTAALDYQAASAAGCASGMLLSFFLNAHFNFKTRDWFPSENHRP